MNDFRSDNRSRDRRDSSRRSFGGRDSGRSSLFDAVCDECGKNCQVPFRPSGDKPIYCSDCFEKRGGRDRRDSSRRDFGDRSPGRFPQNDRSMSQVIEKLDVLNKKLDAITDLLASLAPAGKKEPKPVEGKAKKSKKTKTKKSKTTL
ncbi:hypothetical protein KKF11_03040 [Patescibacteria group bacterium]|nr:hypothetical protein [Patescibacteria group bacterium]